MSHLESIKTEAQIRMDWVRVSCEYNRTLADIAKRQVETETDRERLDALRAARREYERAVKKTKRQERQIENELRTTDIRAKHAERLELGELITPALVAISWAGFFAVVRAAHGDARRYILRMTAADEHRLGMHFSRPQFPSTKIEDAPVDIESAMSLFAWARERLYVPNVGTPPHDILLEIFESLDASAKHQAEQMNARIAVIHRRLSDLRTANWSAMDLGDFPTLDTGNSSKE